MREIIAIIGIAIYRPIAAILCLLNAKMFSTGNAFLISLESGFAFQIRGQCIWRTNGTNGQKN